MVKKALAATIIIVLAFIGLVQGLKWGALSLDDGAESPGQANTIESVPEPDLEARAAVMIDQETGDILYDRGSHSRMYPASTTKILTALLTLENCQRDEVVKAGSELYLVRPKSSVAGLVIGQESTVEELLYALLLPSGNDAAYVLAVHIARQENPDLVLSDQEAVEVFVGLMNKRAAELNMKDSHFINPDGYHHYNHYSSAWDLALLSQKAMEYPLFRQIVSTSVFTPMVMAGNQQLVWKNTNELLVEGSPHYYTWATGIKTGHTEQAGYCLAAAAARDDRKLLCVVLGSSETGVFKDTIELFDYGFDHPLVRTAKTVSGFPYTKIAVLLLACCLLKFMIQLRRKLKGVSRRRFS